MHQGIWRIVLFVVTFSGALVSVYYIFHFKFLGVPLELSYLYFLLALFGSSAFLIFPAKKKSQRLTIPWYDILFFLFLFSSGSYLAYRGYDILYQSWAMAPPLHATIISIVLWLLLIEAVRRTGAIALTIIVIFFSLYPVIAPYLPGMFKGPPVFTIWDVAAYHMLSSTSVMGIPMQVVGLLVIGFIIFGVTLQHTGGGKFFIEFATALLGSFRGGVAKVSIVSSGLFGSLSGAAISNVITTGSITIPAMKKTGYPAHYAGAVESCASTGGVLMPPVMGAAAFVMAMLLEVSYYEVAIAAFIPSMLYFMCLFVQVDAYAARMGLKGLEGHEMPLLWPTIRGGWFYFASVIVLVFFLFYLRQVAVAPFYASGVLLLIAMLKKETRFTLDSFIDYAISMGRFLSELVILLAAVGFIMGSFFVTGVGGTFAHGISNLAGGNVYLLLIFGAMSSFILGMGMTITACYIFLAITVAPALVAAGLNPMAAHLFVLYWGALSYLTPPVALAPMAAAPIAGASGMKIAVMATRLGSVKYIVPFCFVFSPALILQESSLKIILFHTSTALLGVILLGAALERYIIGVGKVGFLSAAFFLVSGLMLFFPKWYVSLPGLAIAGASFFIMWLLRRKEKSRKYPGITEGQQV
jgi:TRAP transporter 4TM/12TM fusion protein